WRAGRAEAAPMAPMAPILGVVGRPPPGPVEHPRREGMARVAEGRPAAARVATVARAVAVRQPQEVSTRPEEAPAPAPA
ncbi:MAG: hypothetical protein ABI560_12195, partial [Myxococcales bacterium]